MVLTHKGNVWTIAKGNKVIFQSTSQSRAVRKLKSLHGTIKLGI